MKKLIWLLIPITVFLFIFSNRDVVAAQTKNLLYISPCEKPREYRYGPIDQEFRLSQSEFESAVTEAAAIWEQAYGRELFTYDPDAMLSIGMKYDARQSLNTEINHLNEEVKQKDSDLKPQIAAYNARNAALKERINALNEEIASWNDQGGAPPEVYERLIEEQRSIEDEISALNSLAESLSLTSDNLLEEAAALEKTVDTFNQALQYKPEGGLYVIDEQGERIEVHIYDSKKQLTHILAHEMGHALGMEHVSDRRSIMYSKTNDVLTPSKKDLAQLAEACKERNVFTVTFNSLAFRLYHLYTGMTTK